MHFKPKVHLQLVSCYSELLVRADVLLHLYFRVERCGGVYDTT